MPDLVLADTSIWVTHFRKSENHLIQLLESGFVVCHPFIIGELACGSLKNRNEIIQLLEALPNVPVLDHQEVMSFIESRKIMSKGIGYVDIHLLGSSLISDIPLWTLDKSLAKVASTLKIEYIKSKR
jgi:predicted nucleic acid-binding protein